MVNEQSKNTSLMTIIAVAILAVVVFVAGFYVGQMNDKTDVVQSELSAADRNYLSQLAYIGGWCERMGLLSSFRTVYNTDLNRFEGVPVCISLVTQ